MKNYTIGWIIFFVLLIGLSVVVFYMAQKDQYLTQWSYGTMGISLIVTLLVGFRKDIAQRSANPWYALGSLIGAVVLWPVMTIVWPPNAQNHWQIYWLSTGIWVVAMFVMVLRVAVNSIAARGHNQTGDKVNSPDKP